MKNMQKLSIIAIATILTACGGGGGGASGNDTDNDSGVIEQPVPPSNYPIDIVPPAYNDTNGEQVYETINKYRTTCGYSSLKQNTLLDTAASGHSNYLTTNSMFGHTQDPSKSGFTGASLSDRANFAGYNFSGLAEIAGNQNAGTLFAGTSPSGIEVPAAPPSGTAMINHLFSTVYHLGIAVQEWSEMGIGVTVSGNLTPLPNETAYYGTTVVNFGNSAGIDAPVFPGDTVRTFPCEGISGVSPIFTAEMPSPYPSRDFNASPMGTPIVISAPNGQEISIAKATITEVTTSSNVKVNIFTSNDDVNKMIKKDQAFIIPDQPLKSNTQYAVSVEGQMNSASYQKTFSFVTGTQH